MKPISNYENVTAIMGGSSNQLPAGGYVCRIKNVEEVKSQAGKDMLEIHFDIDEGQYKDYFLNKYKNQTPYPNGQLKKWPGIYRMVLEGDNWEGRFKGFITSLQESNQGFFWLACNWDTSKLAGLKFGGIFREEEFMGNQGIGKSTKLLFIRSVDTITSGNFEIPQPKKLLNNNAFEQPAPADDLPF